MMRRRMLVFGAFGMLGLIACESSQHAGSPRSSVAKETKTPLEFAFELQPGESTPTRTVQRGDEKIELGPIRRFTISEARSDLDELGYPAIEFTIATDQKTDFEAWTRAGIGRRMIVLLDGAPLVAATIRSALPGSGVISMGPGSSTDEQTRGIAARIVGAR